MFVLFFVVMAVRVMMSVLIILMMVVMFIFMGVFMLVMMVVLMGMRVSMRYPTSVRVLVAVLMREVNVELNSFDGGFMGARNVQMVTMKLQLFQFMLQIVRIDSKIQQCSNKHVAADPAEDIQIQCLHFCSADAARCCFGDLAFHNFISYVAPVR